MLPTPYFRTLPGAWPPGNAGPAVSSGGRRNREPERAALDLADLHLRDGPPAVRARLPGRLAGRAGFPRRAERRRPRRPRRGRRAAGAPRRVPPPDAHGDATRGAADPAGPRAQ